MKRCFGALNPTNAPEEPHEEEGDDDGGDDGQGEAPDPMFHAIEQVHTEDAGDERGEHENDAHEVIVFIVWFMLLLMIEA